MSTAGRVVRFTRALWRRRRCRLCDAPVATATAVCGDCLADLGPVPDPVCAVCGRPGAPTACPGCGSAGWPPVRAAFRYGFPIDRLVLRLKYGPEPALADLLGALVWRRLRDRAPAGAVTLVPVPLHRARLRSRGFNQSALIARRIASATGWPLSHHVRRVRHTAPQTGRGRRARSRNLDGAFRVTAPVAGRVLVIDDVFTTGATSRALTETLAAAGACVVGIWCVAWAPPAAGPGRAQTSTFTAASALRSMNSRRGST